jgi:hypothetical protein
VHRARAASAISDVFLCHTREINTRFAPAQLSSHLSTTQRLR